LLTLATAEPRTPVAQQARVRCDGKFFSAGGERLAFNGVTYGTFRPRADGALFPEREQIAADMTAIAASGFTVVRTYTTPPPDLIEQAASEGLRLYAGAFFEDWRYALGATRTEHKELVRRARAEVRETARALRGDPTVLALSIGNEIPADVVRWVGTRRVAALLDDLVAEVKDVDPDLLVSYANYPTAEYLPLESLDFLTFNVFLERRRDFRAYLTRLHHLAGDRPLVLGEVGLDANAGEDRQAEVIDWQLESALERGVAGTCVFSWTDEWAVGGQPVEGWRFGLTDADREPRPALEVARAANERTLSDLDFHWPSMSVVICAHNAADTLDECLRHACALEYPDLEVIVVDDGSTDDTAAIANRHPRAQLIRLPENHGLSAARNVGYRAGTGDLIAFLDADAFPGPEWPYLLALAFDGPNVGAAGGPNLPPLDDPWSARSVALAPGGPVHVLLDDHRAEHVPGCNLAAWRIVLDEVGGFDPVYRAAGDDVDLCWKVLDRGWDIGFHPAAAIWHRRRAGVGAYARQQRGYGRAERLVQERHPDRFTAAGTARWRGSIYDALVPSAFQRRVYHGQFGAAAYQSVYRGGGHMLDLAHQLGVPAAALSLALAPLALLAPALIALPALALAVLIVLFAMDMARATPPRDVRERRTAFRAHTALLHLIQPMMRLRGRIGAGEVARLPADAVALPGPAQDMPGRVLLLPADRPRAELVPVIVTALRRAGLPVDLGTGWEEHDAVVRASGLVVGRLLTSSHPEGSVQVRIRLRLRVRALVCVTAAVVALVPLAWPAAALSGALVLGELGRGAWRADAQVRALIRRAAR
jgi:glycosyltransferase involved in cell wall biosynthesis